MGEEDKDKDHWEKEEGEEKKGEEGRQGEKEVEDKEKQEEDKNFTVFRHEEKHHVKQQAIPLSRPGMKRKCRGSDGVSPSFPRALLLCTIEQIWCDDNRGVGFCYHDWNLLAPERPWVDNTEFSWKRR